LTSTEDFILASVKEEKKQAELGSFLERHMLVYLVLPELLQGLNRGCVWEWQTGQDENMHSHVISNPNRRVGIAVDRNISLFDFYVLLSTKLNIPLKSIALFYFNEFSRWPRLLVQSLEALNKRTNKLAALYKKKGDVDLCVLYVHDLRIACPGAVLSATKTPFHI
jgi:hypothetical protein